MENLEMPEMQDDTTYIVGSTRCIKLFKKDPKARRLFEKDLRGMQDIVVKRKIRYEVEPKLGDDYVYVVDTDDVQLVIAMEWVDTKSPIDISRFDA